MQEKILSFIQILRKSGLKVSLVETLDCFNALNYINWDKETFFITLRTTLVKDYEYNNLFERLFDLYFDEEFFLHNNEKSHFDSSDNRNQNPKSEIKQESSCTNSDCGQGSGGVTGEGKSSYSTGNFVETVLLGSDMKLQQLIKEGINSLGGFKETDIKDKKELIRKIKVNLKWKMGEYELEKLLPNLSEEKKLKIQDRLARLEESLHAELDAELIRNFESKALEEILRRTDLTELEFFKLTDNQIKDIRRKITKLAHKLATRVSRREVKAKKGKIKLSTTIRKAITTGGVPIYPVYKSKKPSKPEFLILCDLSGSVRIFSEFMLQLVYSIQSRFINVRSFAFVDTVQEITGYFANSEIEDAIKAIYYDGKYSKTGFSHYGESLLSFNSKYLNLISKRTTVLMLGDARNNYQPPYLEELKKIKELAYRIIWLNPAPRPSWDSDDSIIGVYKSQCSQLYECRNLLQLEQVVKKIF